MAAGAFPVASLNGIKFVVIRGTCNIISNKFRRLKKLLPN